MANLATERIRAEMFQQSDIDVAAEAGGDTFVNNDRTMLAVRNDDASEHTVTVVAQESTVGVQGLGDVSISDIEHAVPAESVAILNIPTKGYVDPATGRTSLTYDAVTSVFVKPVEFDRL